MILFLGQVKEEFLEERRDRQCAMLLIVQIRR